MIIYGNASSAGMTTDTSAAQQDKEQASQTTQTFIINQNQ